MRKIKSYERRKARKLVLQGLYQWFLTQNALSEIEEQFVVENKVKKTDMDYFRELFYEIPKVVSEIDHVFENYLDRELDQLSLIEITILRIGTYELLYRLDVPCRVVINEAVELGKDFGAEGSFKYINSILDKVGQQKRSSEMVKDSRRPKKKESKN